MLWAGVEAPGVCCPRPSVVEAVLLEDPESERLAEDSGPMRDSITGKKTRPWYSPNRTVRTST